MIVKVFHAKTNFFRTSMVYSGSPDDQKLIAIYFDEVYDEVAEVKTRVDAETTGASVGWALDEAYHLTQNLDHPWVMNEGVSSSAIPKRSSSVGDVFLFDNRYYVVANFGFDDVTDLFKKYGHA